MRNKILSTLTFLFFLQFLYCDLANDLIKLKELGLNDDLIVKSALQSDENLKPADLVKLMEAGFSSKIIEKLMSSNETEKIKSILSGKTYVFDQKMGPIEKSSTFIHFDDDTVFITKGMEFGSYGWRSSSNKQFKYKFNGDKVSFQPFDGKIKNEGQSILMQLDGDLVLLSQIPEVRYSTIPASVKDYFRLLKDIDYNYLKAKPNNSQFDVNEVDNPFKKVILKFSNAIQKNQKDIALSCLHNESPHKEDFDIQQSPVFYFDTVKSIDFLGIPPNMKMYSAKTTLGEVDIVVAEINENFLIMGYNRTILRLEKENSKGNNSSNFNGR